MKQIITTLLFLTCFLVGTVSGEKPKAVTPITAFNKTITKLASEGGFSDDDAIKASFSFLEFLIGPKQEGQKKISRIVVSEAEKVRVFVSYDIGIKFFGYEFEYSRGDIKKGMRWAHFSTLKHISSE